MKLLPFLLLAFLLLSCNCDDEMVLVTDEPACGTLVRIDPSEAWRAGAEIPAVTVNGVFGSCIDISYGASGCDVESIRAFLYTNGTVLESFPTQTEVSLRIDPERQTACLAVFARRDTFDLSPYIGTEPTNLTIAGADTTVFIE